VHSGGSVKPIQLRTIMILPITASAPSSLPVMTMPATLPLMALRPVALYSSSSASNRSMTRCIRLERPPHQIGVQNSTMSAALIRAAEGFPHRPAVDAPHPAFGDYRRFLTDSRIIRR